jgi:hypothetical protein
MERRIMIKLKGSLQWNKCSNGENDNNLIFSKIGINSIIINWQQMFAKIVFSSGELERTIYKKWLKGFIKKTLKIMCVYSWNHFMDCNKH